MTATCTYTVGRFVWRELFTRDVEGVKRFYGELFGWTVVERPMGGWSYWIWKNGDREIGGLMDFAHVPGDLANVPAHWEVSVSVADVDRAAAAAVAAGGRLLTECMDIPGAGRFALVQDPQGAALKLFRSAYGDPAESCPENGDFCWENLSTTGPAAAAVFYEKVVGWRANPMPGSETLVFARQADGEAVDLASVGMAPPGSPSTWGTFVAVARVDDAVARAAALGGQVLHGRTEIPGVGAFAVLQDPGEAVFFVFEAA